MTYYILLKRISVKQDVIILVFFVITINIFQSFLMNLGAINSIPLSMILLLQSLRPLSYIVQQHN